jgi:hypothetical protein
VKPGIKEHIGEWIALIVTLILAGVLLGFGSVMAWQVIQASTVDTTLSRSFDMLLLAFVAVWRTNFGGGDTNVTADQANVTGGAGAPTAANVERQTVITETQPAIDPAEQGG